MGMNGLLSGVQTCASRKPLNRFNQLLFVLPFDSIARRAGLFTNRVNLKSGFDIEGWSLEIKTSASQNITIIFSAGLHFFAMLSSPVCFESMGGRSGPFYENSSRV